MADTPLTTSSDLTPLVEPILKTTKVIPLHTHNGVDSLQIMQSSIINGTTIAASGSTALTGNVILAGGTNVTVTESGQTITINSTAVTNIFGDGSNGTGIADGVAVMAGLTPSGNIYTMIRDIYLVSLTISTGVTIIPSGYQIFTQETTTINGTGKIAYNGNTGGNGGTSTGGTGGAALSGGTLPPGLAGLAGGNGGVGGGSGGSNGGGGTAGNTGTSTNPSIGANGVSGTGTAGNGGGSAVGSGGAGATAGVGGTATLALNNPNTLFGSFIHADLLSSYTQHQGSAVTGSSGGGGGGGSSVNSTGGGGGGGGGTGSTGGIVALFSKNIINNAIGGIQANGGNGGTGGNGGNGSGTGISAGGGGAGVGGSGGTGGVIILVYSSLTQNGSFTVNGGSAGANGTPGVHQGNNSGGDGGAVIGNGSAGGTGTIWQYQV